MNTTTTPQRPVLVAISGASGAIYGIELLRMLRRLGAPSAVIISNAGRRTIALETDLSVQEVAALADRAFEVDDVAAPPASGSFRLAGMVVAPCSIKTLSAIANSHADNLLTRAADVQIKERRPLVLMVRETPLHAGHLELMLRCARLGAVIMPPVPAFYHAPRTAQDIVAHTVGRVLDVLGLEHELTPRWEGA